MADWITDVDTPTSRLERWNKRGGVMHKSRVLNDPANQAVVAIFMIFNDVLTDAQINALEQLLTDDTMPDATSLNYLGQLRALVKAVKVEGGIKAPADLIALPDKVWTAIAELRIRCDDAPPTP